MTPVHKHKPARPDRGPDQLARDLIGAAYRGSNDEVESALAAGADVNTRENGSGLTPLHIAVGTNNSSLTQLLVQKYSSSFGPDSFGRWPTVVAAECRVSGDLCDFVVQAEEDFLRRTSALD